MADWIVPASGRRRPRLMSDIGTHIVPRDVAQAAAAGDPRVETWAKIANRSAVEQWAHGRRVVLPGLDVLTTGAVDG